MNHNTPTSTDKVTSGMFVGVLTSGALAAALLGSTPTANASCVSAFGISSSPDCSSALTGVAVAIGTGATAGAHGLFGAALAIGNYASADIPIDSFVNIFNIAIAQGPQSRSTAGGIATVAVVNGDSGYADSRGILGLAVVNGTRGYAATSGQANTAINLGDHVDYNWADAYGTGNLAVNLGGDGRVVAGFDTLSIASVAFNTGGTNTVKTNGGPFAVAGAVNQDGATVSQNGPGININNGAAVSETAALGSKAMTTSVAGISRTKRTTPTTIGLNSIKKTIAAAAADFRDAKKVKRFSGDVQPRTAADTGTRQLTLGRHPNHRTAISNLP